ncbi:MAG: AraC family transcriptional regulator [Ruminococcaceae bacterium]|nr:AraC family transcriptional regulator [Oscillospiraceae bacterium]
MFLYQRDNSTHHHHIHTMIYDDFKFEQHLHSDLELVFPLAGAVNICLRDREEEIKCGEMALVLPNELHSFYTPESSQVLVCVFSPDYVQSFAGMIEGKRGEKSVFPCSKGVKAIINETFFELSEPGDMHFKAVFYAVCAHYLSYVGRFQEYSQVDGVLEKVIRYVEENYRENITLSDAARAIGYSESYISRCFHQTAGINFRRFLNYYRIQYVCRNMSDKKGISELALAAGFQNLRSFNRAFQESMGMAPRDYFGKSF